MHGKGILEGSVCKYRGFCAREGRFEGVGVQKAGILCTGNEMCAWALEERSDDGAIRRPAGPGIFDEGENTERRKGRGG